MKLKRNIYAFVLVVTSVSGAYFAGRTTAQTGAAPQTTADNEYQAGATLWMQKAAEYRALAYQAFNLARWQLDSDFDKKTFKKGTSDPAIALIKRHLQITGDMPGGDTTAMYNDTLFQMNGCHKVFSHYHQDRYNRIAVSVL